MTTNPTEYPVRIEATLDSPLSRWKWLLKWLLAIPHYVLLVFLWLAFVGLSVAAFVSILATGRYPRPIFDFNVGVLRWTWRVQYYAYGALATDRYPPFTLAEVPNYPAHLEIAYPTRLSRGLVLVKWWLLALPHYLVIALFTGGVVVGLWRYPFGGLIGLLALFAGAVLLFAGRYPQGVFDFMLGMDRWVLRVAAYAALMTDTYPPFRMDLGGHDPADPLEVTSQQSSQVSERGKRLGWTGWRSATVVAGVLLGLLSFSSVVTGGVLLWVNQSLRDASGYLTMPVATVHADGYALASRDIDLSRLDAWNALGEVRVRVTPVNTTAPVFIGIAPSSSANTYLAGVAYTSVSATGKITTIETHSGGAPTIPPDRTAIWVAQATGTGTQNLIWSPSSGQWTVLVMNANATPGVTVAVSVGATLPGLADIGTWLLVLGVIVSSGAVLMVAVPISRVAKG